MFTTTYGTSDLVEAKGIEQLISDFSSNSIDFKSSMQSMNFAEKSSSTSIQMDKIKLTSTAKKDRKMGPIKAERITIKKPIIRVHSQS
jgi:hypothetical protein